MKQKKINYAFILLLSLKVYFCYSFSITESPICTKVAPSRANIYSLCVGNRTRSATLQGITWFHKRYLAITSLPDEALYTYLFDENKKILTPIQEITNEQGAQLGYPEHLSVSPDGTLLAIANSSNSTVNIYSIDPQTHLINPLPAGIFKLSENKTLLHGIKFSSTGSHLAITEITNPGLIRVYRLENMDHDKLNLVLTCTLNNTYAPMKPKAIDFSSDDTYVTIAYACNAGTKQTKSSLAIHRFDKIKGVIDPNHTYIRQVEISYLEDVKFFSNDAHLIVINQLPNDTAVIYDFDKTAGILSDSFITIKNPVAQLSFPHAVAISYDSKYAAIVNSGSNQCNIYSIQS